MTNCSNSEQAFNTLEPCWLRRKFESVLKFTQITSLFSLSNNFKFIISISLIKQAKHKLKNTSYIFETLTVLWISSWTSLIYVLINTSPPLHCNLGQWLWMPKGTWLQHRLISWRMNATGSGLAEQGLRVFHIFLQMNSSPGQMQCQINRHPKHNLERLH